MDLRNFQWLTFDCYGTLIDWERGILDALRPVLAVHGAAAPDNTLLELYATVEAQLEAQPYRPYRAILRSAAEHIFTHFKLTPTGQERNCLAHSLPHWPPFFDSSDALRRLKKHFKLAILSNIDDDLLSSSIRLLDVKFDAVITAQQLGSYKPARAHFEAALQLPGATRHTLLHVAQSLYHDIAPANALGISSVWINRRHGFAGSGATPAAYARCSLETHDLKTLADLADKSFA